MSTLRQETSKANKMPSQQVLERGARALELSKAGLTYREIAEQLGVNASTVHGYVVRTLRWSVGQAGAEEIFQREVARLDSMLRAIWPKVLNGDLHAVDRALRISARRAALYGLDAPTKVHLDGQITVTTTADLDAELRGFFAGSIPATSRPTEPEQEAEAS